VRGFVAVFPKKTHQTVSIPTEGVRDRTTLSLSPAVKKSVPVTKVWSQDELPPALEIGEAVPSDAKERQRCD